MELIPIPGIPLPGAFVRPPEGEGRRPLAMAFITPQGQFTKHYPAMKALQRGTAFEELEKPFYGKRGAN